MGGGVRARSRDRGSVIEACYSAMGLLSAGGRLPQAEKSRDPAARSPSPQVYDAAEGDRDNDACGAAARYKNSSGREFTRESAGSNGRPARSQLLKSASVKRYVERRGFFIGR